MLIAWLSADTRLTAFQLRPVEVNGGPGSLFLDRHQQVVGVMALDIAAGQIWCVSSIANPDKLTHLGPVGDFTSLLNSARPSTVTGVE